MILSVDFVKDSEKREFVSIQYTACMDHIAQQCVWGFASACIDCIDNCSGKGCSQSFCDEGPAGTPSKYFDLSWGIDKYNIDAVAALLQQQQQRTEFGSKKIEGCENGPVGSKLVMLHDPFIIDAVSDVDICWEIQS